MIISINMYECIVFIFMISLKLCLERMAMGNSIQGYVSSRDIILNETLSFLN